MSDDVTAGGQHQHRYIDVGVNLCDDMYKGIYHGKQRHASDISTVLSRAERAGVDSIVLTSGNLNDAQNNCDIISQYRPTTTVELYTTIGVHPTRASEFDGCSAVQSQYMRELRQLYMRMPDRIIWVGECGLDYDRLQYSSVQQQRVAFSAQIQLAGELGLPLFLHNRNCSRDFNDIVHDHREIIERVGGVVHSYTGDMQDMIDLCKLGLYIGINGCSLRTEENCSVAAAVPLNRMVVETDAPWCTIKSTHASSRHVITQVHRVKPDKYSGVTDDTTQVKDRNEPCNITHIVQALSALRNESMKTIADACYANTQMLLHRRCGASITDANTPETL